MARMLGFVMALGALFMFQVGQAHSEIIHVNVADYAFTIGTSGPTGNKTWLFMYNTFGETDSNFVSGGSSYKYYTDWQIGYYKNILDYNAFQNYAWQYIENGDYAGYYKISYQQLDETFEIYALPNTMPGIYSNDVTFDLYAQLTLNENPNQPFYKLISGTIMGYGHNTNDNNTYFTFTMQLIGDVFDYNNKRSEGYLTSFTIDYYTNSSPVPLPGSVWLLGTGLAGLACLLRRRRRSRG